MMGLCGSWRSTRWLPYGVLAIGCATPIREDPPSKLGAGDTDGGAGNGGASGGLTANTSSANTSAQSTTASVTSGSSSTTATSGSATTASSQASTSATSGSSGSGGTAASSSTDAGSGGNGGSGGTGGSESTSATTTGGIVITGDLPWMDDFEGYTADGPAGPNWTALESSGAWTVVADGNQFYGPQGEGSNRNMTYAGDPAWTNVRFQVDLRLREGGDSTRIYLAVRAGLPEGATKLEYYHAYVNGAGRVQLGSYLNGSTTEDTSAHQADTGVALDGTTWHTFAVTVAGDTVTAELDGVEAVSGQLSGRTAGFIALGVQSGLAEFDNVSVSEP